MYPWKPTRFDELRYAIRSAALHFTSLRRCWVYSEVPPTLEAPWITWVESANRGRHADEVIIRRLLRACDDPAVSDPFVFSCDDYYWLQPTSAREMDRVIALQTMDLRDPYEGPNLFKRRLWRTLLELDRLGFTAHNYCTHTPLLIHKRAFRDAIEIMGLDVQIDSAYLNIAWNRPPQYYLSELPWKAGFYQPTPPAEIISRIAGRRFLSHDDDGLTPVLAEAIQRMFPRTPAWPGAWEWAPTTQRPAANRPTQRRARRR